MWQETSMKEEGGRKWKMSDVNSAESTMFGGRRKFSGKKKQFDRTINSEMRAC
jgi:hypothetical protein